MDGPGGEGVPGFQFFSKQLRAWQRAGLKLRQWGGHFALNKPDWGGGRKGEGHRKLVLLVSPTGERTEQECTPAHGVPPEIFLLSGMISESNVVIKGKTLLASLECVPMTAFIQTDENLVRQVPHLSSPKNLISMCSWKLILSVVFWSVC